MLHLKRASAGSGKTYQLAKTYIKLLLTVKEGKKRRLRTEETLDEAVSSIMAVTFTVKATGEMKQRIVQKLADLARADIVDEKEVLKIDYLSDFIEDYNTNRFEIARLAKAALRRLLLHYSDFKVQTIDSFFQSILHTFAYEANLDDNFNTEIDTDLVASIGFDTALEQITGSVARTPEEKETLYWLHQLMSEKEESNKWNVFAKNDNEGSLYHSLIKASQNLEKEDYHLITKELSEYFASLNRPFSEVIKEVDRRNLGELKRLYEKTRVEADNLREVLRSAGLPENALRNFHVGRLKETDPEFEKVQIEKFKYNRKKINLGENKTGFAHSLKGDMQKSWAKKAENSHLVAAVDDAYDGWFEAYNEFALLLEEKWNSLLTWLHYKKMIPRLMVVLAIAEKKKEYLDSINTVQLSDTTSILSRIIGKDDTPFIYERMGTRLRHYLIDEFQDTSRMQWNNLYPLLAESESTRNDNLIIGDAKQSIYRFRNADYRLILEVENLFDEVVPYTSDNPPKDPATENTNFRSRPEIVEFNNYIFSNIINLDGKEKDKKIFNDDIRRIYADCSQAVAPQKLKEGVPGYVEIIFHPKETDESEDASFFEVSADNPGFKELPERILKLRERGYRLRDIGILVRSHRQGDAVLKVLSHYNSEHPDDQIKIISEENLLVSSSVAVRLITYALEKIAGVPAAKVPDNAILMEPVNQDELFRMVSELPAMSLPALVEAIAEKFLKENIRNEQAPFIAAFQDAVIDYCSSHPSDINLFLKWWRRKSKGLSINSPEESDGVKILTIHKAKGLEFKCVVIPYCDFSFLPSNKKAEWRWVRPHAEVAGSELLPPFLPVLTDSKLGKTLHNDILKQHTDNVALDELNNMYVAFTRPVNELYVYVPEAKENMEYTSYGALRALLGEEFERKTEEVTEEEEAEVKKTREVVLTGRPLTTEEITVGNKEGRETILLDTYEVATEGAKAQFEDGKKLINTRLSPEEEGADTDPRSEGNLKHRIMQLIEVPDDLEAAVHSMKVDGLVSSTAARKWTSQLREAIESVSGYGWFEPGLRVINERPILCKGMKPYRPDRIVIDSRGIATVIDYKFGEPDRKYHKQVKNYMSLLQKSGVYAGVKGYIWYVAEGKVEAV